VCGGGGVEFMKCSGVPRSVESIVFLTVEFTDGSGELSFCLTVECTEGEVEFLPYIRVYSRGSRFFAL
jgi:hypothetical protein